MTPADTIPHWSILGVLPPIRPDSDAASPDRSPYCASPLDLCHRFGVSPERRRILSGLWELRADLRAVGLDDGFQWVDGSFVEDVETTHGRPPADIDVVTFAPLGDGDRQRRLVAGNPDLFYPQRAKRRYLVDHYVVATDVAFDAVQAHRVSYWYSMWSHRREDQRWKGFLELALSEEDGAARAWHAQFDEPGVSGEGNHER